MHTEQTILDRSEQLLPDEDLDVAVIANAETVEEVCVADLSDATNQHPRWNSISRREKVRSLTKTPNNTRQPQDTAAKADNERKKRATPSHNNPIGKWIPSDKHVYRSTDRKRNSR